MRIQTLVLTPKIFAQVDQTIKVLEFQNGVVRESVDYQNGNRFGMKGNTILFLMVTLVVGLPLKKK